MPRTVLGVLMTLGNLQQSVSQELISPILQKRKLRLRGTERLVVSPKVTQLLRAAGQGCQGARRSLAHPEMPHVAGPQAGAGLEHLHEDSHALGLGIAPHFPVKA